MSISKILILAGLIMACGCARSNTNASAPDTTVNPDKPGTKADPCALKFPNTQLCGDLVWELEPNETTKGSFLIHFTRDGQPASPSPLAVSVKLWMPDMGHGSTPTTVTRVDDFTYRASDVFFVMSGKWEIRVPLSAGSDVKDTAVGLYDAKN